MFQIVVFLISFNLSTSKKNQSKQKLKKKWYSLHDFMLLQIKSMAPGAKRWPGFFWRPWAPQVEDCRNLYKGTKWLYYCRGWTNQIRGYRVQILAIEMNRNDIKTARMKQKCLPSVCEHLQTLPVGSLSGRSGPLENPGFLHHHLLLELRLQTDTQDE